MAYFSGTIRSTALAMDTGLTVILPYDYPVEERQTPCPVLYLLHGLGDNHAAWTRHTAVEAYACAKGVAVVMPEVQRSFYSDMASLPYYTYVTEELPELCARMFRLSGKREDTLIAGLSMGGYGAVKCGLTRPDRYRGCASFSGVLDVVRVLDKYRNGKSRHELVSILGPELAVPDQENLLRLAEAAGRLNREQLPDLFFTCATGDFLYDINRGFLQHLDALGLPYTYREWTGGHEWSFWDESVRLALERWF